MAIVNPAKEHEAARWLSECITNMHTELNLTPGQVILLLLKEIEREGGQVLWEEGADT